MPGPFYEEGRYKAEVINQALGKNANTGTPQFVLRCRIVCQLIGDQEKQVRQYERSIYMFLSDKAAPYTIEKLKAIGFNGPGIRQLDPSHQAAHSFLGQILELDCKYEEDRNSGELREKWELAWSGGGTGEIENITPLSAAETRKLDALFGKSLGASAPRAASRSTTTKETATAVAEPAVEGDTVITDDDIPF